MASKLPYMASPGLIPKIFEKIQEARRPDRFTQDFLETKLGFAGGSARAVLPLLKRLGFLSSDGTPTKLYDQFRNANSRTSAMNEGIKNAFSELYERSQYAQAMSKDKLTGHVTEITGATKDDTTTKCIVNTFLALEEFANFDLDTTDEISDKNINHVDRVVPITTSGNNTPTAAGTDDVNFAVSYTINLNLPETTNPEVFNAIFRALRDNLLTRR